MRHRILTCKNHTDLRWGCKDIAWSGFYNGSRNIFFWGVPDGTGIHSDGSGLSCTQVPDDPNGPHTSSDGRRYRYIEECKCPAGDLILAPEDELVTC